MKRILAILMALVMLFSLAACTVTEEDNDSGAVSKYEFTTGYDETKYNAPGTFPIFKEKQEISLLVPDNQYLEDYDTNLQSLMYEEQLNADLVFTVLPEKEYKTKVNLMAAAGGEEYPDGIIASSFADGMILNLVDADVIVPLTEYFYNYDIAPNCIEAIDRLGWDYYPYITMPDGEIYGVPTINDSIAVQYKDKMWVYEPWFEAAGVNIDDIHTTEDFKEALLKVVKNDPNGNGKADEVGITSWTSSNRWFKYLMTAFVYAGDSDYIYVKDGEVGFSYRTEEWKEGLKYIKELYDLGLIDPLAFSQDVTGCKAMLNYQDTIVAAFAHNYRDLVSVDDPRFTEYRAISPLNSSWNDGEPLSIVLPTEPEAAMIVSLNAEDPEMVFRMGDLMVGEASSVHTRWGKEGVDWIRPREGDKSRYDVLGYEPYLVEILEWSTLQNSHWCSVGPFIRQKAIAAGVVDIEAGKDEEQGEAILKYLTAAPDEYVTKLVYTEEENEIISEYLANIKTYVLQMSTKFVMGDADIDAEWDAFQSQLETLNVEGVLECAQTAYDRMK